ncbi:MAG: hypothetical protein IPJ86_07400 [Bacteroidetes bacterium]|nr:hypothetical protein [Bacteroidota bacterium]
MKKIFCALLLMTAVVGCEKVFAQYNGNHWCFGDSAYINWSNPSNPVVGNAAYYRRNGSSTIGDSTGLLLYAGLINNWAPTDCYVWNKYHQRIGDSTNIYGGFWYHSNLFIPNPGNDSLIYLLTIGVTNDPYGFYSSIINYKANNDSGFVLQKNFQWNNFPAFDGLMGVRHGNGRDWWVVFQRYTTSLSPFNSFYLFLVNVQGISGPFIQNIGTLRKTGGGQLIFNSNGSQFAQVSWLGMIELYNFDRCTGTITSTIPIEQEPATSPYTHTVTTCAYSKDDSKLYVIDLSQSNSTYYLLQYDLLATNIAASKFVVDTFVIPVAPWTMKLAPDGKIYIAAADGNYSWPYPDTSTAFTTVNNNLSVINYPDSLGSACDFQPFSFNLGTGRSYFGLPNNPDYELGAWVGSPCDTLSVGVDDNVPQQEVFFQAWYNSEWNMIHVNASKLKGRTGSLRLFDMEVKPKMLLSI